MGQMPAVGEIHAEDPVARLQQRGVHRDVRLRAGVGLHVGVFRAEERLCARDREALDLVDVFAAAVIACAGVALGVFIGQIAPHRFDHGAAREVLGGDQLDVVLLPPQLALHGGKKLGVRLNQFFIVQLDTLLFFAEAELF